MSPGVGGLVVVVVGGLVVVSGGLVVVVVVVVVGGLVVGIGGGPGVVVGGLVVVVVGGLVVVVVGGLVVVVVGPDPPNKSSSKACNQNGMVSSNDIVLVTFSCKYIQSPIGTITPKTPMIKRNRTVIKLPRQGRSQRGPSMSGHILVAMVSIYNSSKWLRHRIDNLIQTDTYKRQQLLIYLANATSPDPKDDEICRAYSVHPHIRYETIPTCTVYSAWNWMIKRTDTAFITNANSDDLVAPESYDILIDGCVKHGADLSYPSWYTIGDGPTKWSDISGTGEQIGFYNPDAGQMSCGHGPLWKRSIHDQIGLFDPSFMALGDADLWYRAWVSGIRNFLPVHAPLMGYRWRDGDNLWHRTPDDKRAGEWQTISSRRPGKLEFE